MNLNKAASEGFDGSVSGMSLPDLIQIKNLGRFSGSLSVDHGDQKGMIFFREGEIVHAELGSQTGTEACFTILMWDNGKFIFTPKVAAPCRTINESLTFLLLEAHRLKDEEDQTPSFRQVEEKLPDPPPQGESAMSSINVKLKTIPEVEYAVVLNKAGVAADDDSYEGASHAANAYYLAMFAGKLGMQLGAGELASAAVTGNDHHLLVFQSKNHYLSVTVSGSHQLGAVEATVRKTLSQK